MNFIERHPFDDGVISIIYNGTTTKFYFSRRMICAASDYFAKLFSFNGKEHSEVKIEEIVSPMVFSIVLGYIWSKETPDIPDVSTYTNLIKCADFFLMGDLTYKVIEYLFSIKCTFSILFRIREIRDRGENDQCARAHELLTSSHTNGNFTPSLWCQSMMKDPEVMNMTLQEIWSLCSRDDDGMPGIKNSARNKIINAVFTSLTASQKTPTNGLANSI